MMSEERFRLIKIDDYVFQIHDIDNDLYLVAEQICNLLNEQQDTINKLREILAEAEDMIDVRLAEHYIKEYENIKHHIIGENDE